jgi:hypothetical protein
MTTKPASDWLAKFHEAGNWDSFRSEFAAGTPFSLFENWVVNAQCLSIGPDDDGVYRRYVETYGRLLTRSDMRHVWKYLDERDDREPGKGYKEVFVSAISEALAGLVPVMLETDKQRANWIKRVQSAADTLADILDERPAYRDKDKDIPQDALDAIGYSDGILELTTWYRTPKLTSETRALATGLRQIGRDLSDLEKGGVTVGKPDQDSAPRIYFQHYLTEFCNDVLGAKPSRILEIVTEVAFDADARVDVMRSTRRRAPVITAEPRRSRKK